jgi:hypothetical protein
MFREECLEFGLLHAVVLLGRRIELVDVGADGGKEIAAPFFAFLVKFGGTVGEVFLVYYLLFELLEADGAQFKQARAKCIISSHGNESTPFGLR